MVGNTPCIRCGKTRIISETWTEKIGGSMATFVLTVCPDPVCQKIVDKELQKKQDKLIMLHKKSLERRSNFRLSRKNHLPQ